MGLFQHKTPTEPPSTEPPSELTVDTAPHPFDDPQSNEKLKKHSVLPVYNHNGHLVTKGIHPDGESGRTGIHPLHFAKVAWKSTCPVSKMVNVLWPFVPTAIVLHFARPDRHVWIFAINYIAMVPCANLLGFAGQELARKLPKVAGILIETALGSVVEIVLFMVLIVKDSGTGTGEGNFIPVIQAAILGSILTNLLLCLGACFFVGGLRRSEQSFHATISEVGSGLLLVAGFALLIPSAFFSALQGVVIEDANAEVSESGQAPFTLERLHHDTLKISQATSIILILAFIVYIWYNARTHDTIFADILEADEEADEDRHKDLKKAKFTFTEAVIAIIISLVLISLIAVFLVEEIQWIVKNRHIPDNFLGLILVPLVEKAAEHLTAIDEAWDNQIVSLPFRRSTLPCPPSPFHKPRLTSPFHRISHSSIAWAPQSKPPFSTHPSSF